MFSLGIRFKVGLVIALGMGITLALIYAAAANLTSSVLRDSEEKGLQEMGQVLGPTLLNLAHDEEELQRAIDDAREGASLELLQVLNPRLETLLQSSGRPAETLLGRQRLEQILRKRPRVALVRAAGLGPLFVHLRPIPGGGYLLLARSARGYEARNGAMLGTMASWGVIIMLAMLLFAALLYRAIVKRPIEKLLQEAGEIATGASRFEDSVENEDFGVLKESLRSMAKRIKTDRARIESQVEELERVNRQLTEAQEQLIRTEKLASVGQLAAGMAHEIGNPIGIVLGYLDMLMGDQLDLEQREKAHTQIRSAVERVDAVIKDLLNFSRPALDEESFTDPVMTVKSVVGMVQPQKRFRNVKIDIYAELPEHARVAMPPSRFKQILLNLMFNASDAMEASGRIGIRLKRNDENVEIVLEDSGPGIPEKLLLKVFDPFFTTKEPGSGTGLGLFVCHTLVNRYEGALEVSNLSEGGARFMLRLPCQRSPGDTEVS